MSKVIRIERCVGSLYVIDASSSAEISTEYPFMIPKRHCLAKSALAVDELWYLTRHLRAWSSCFDDEVDAARFEEASREHNVLLCAYAHLSEQWFLRHAGMFGAHYIAYDKSRADHSVSVVRVLHSAQEDAYSQENAIAFCRTARSVRKVPLLCVVGTNGTCTVLEHDRSPR